jgi:hypothetical protein
LTAVGEVETVALVDCCWWVVLGLASRLLHNWDLSMCRPLMGASKRHEHILLCCHDGFVCECKGAAFAIVIACVVVALLDLEKMVLVLLALSALEGSEPITMLLRTGRRACCFLGFVHSVLCIFGGKSGSFCPSLCGRRCCKRHTS